MSTTGSGDFERRIGLAVPVGCQSGTGLGGGDHAVLRPPAFVSSGRITAASIVGPGGAQQLGSGELPEWVAALRAGVAHVNVHTNLSPGGGIRGQVEPGH